MWLILTATIFVVGVSCGPVSVPTPAIELEPPKYDAVPFSDEVTPSGNDVPTLATDLVPPLEDGPAPPTADLVPPPKRDAPEPPATELLPPFEDNVPIIAPGVIPPPEPKDEKNEKPLLLFLVNVFAVKNHTAEDSNDVLHSDFMKEVPEETTEPLGMFLLVVEDENEEMPVSLDEVAKDLEAEGFVVDKIVKDGETQLIKVDLNSAETRVKIDDNAPKDDRIEQIIEQGKEKKSSEYPKKVTEMEKKDHVLEESGKLMKVRRKRHICLKCMVDDLKSKKTYGGGGYGGGCGGGCGGGNYYPQPQPVYQPVVVQPVYVVPVQGGGGHRKHHGGGGGGGGYCNVCQQGGGGGNYGGGYGGGYGGSHATASAQATASASAQSYGG